MRLPRVLGGCSLRLRFWARRPQLEAHGWWDCFSEVLVGSQLGVWISFVTRQILKMETARP